MTKNKNIGLFGGLFDPPHIAHLILAQSVLEEFSLNKIIFIPAFNPPHKRSFSPYKIRRHMLELAIKGNPRFKISDVESSLTGKTYTIDVVKTLKAKISDQLFLIIGSDQWIEIENWKTPDKISRYCRIIVIPRPGFSIKTIKDMIMVSRSPGIAISSTLIRMLVRSGRSVTYLVPRAVEKYIKQKRLYISC